MKRISLGVLTLLLSSASLIAQTYKESHPECKPDVDIYPTKTVLLYPEGQTPTSCIRENGIAITRPPKEDNGLRGEEKCSTSGSRSNIGNDARIDIYLPKHCNGQMVILTPGGGYTHVATFKEGAYGTKLLNDHGIATCVLKYRMPNYHASVPLDDVQNALRYCRYHAAEWGIKQIGVMGGSAGSHVAAMASVLYTDSITRPDFAVLLYPRLTLRKGDPWATRKNLMGDDQMWKNDPEGQQKLLTYYSTDTHVTAQTPPTFMAISADDNGATNLVPHYIKLIENKVPCEVHVYSKGGHGWGFYKNEYRKNHKGDTLAHYRNEFETSLLRWLGDQLNRNL